MEADSADRAFQRLEEIKQDEMKKTEMLCEERLEEIKQDEMKKTEMLSEEINRNLSDALLKGQNEERNLKEEEILIEPEVKLEKVNKDETESQNRKETETIKVKEENPAMDEKQREIDDEELKKLNRKVPEARSTFKKDDVDEHFDRLPWFVGALGRVLSLPFSYGPKFAPINISVSRRMQTFAVFVWMSSFLCMGFGSLFFLIYLFFYSQYWWISLAYFTWYLGDRTICDRGGRRLSVMRNWCLWKNFRAFFPAHLIKTAELDPSKNYIMGYHPHGVLSAGAFCHFATESTYISKVFPGLIPYLLTLDIHFKLPFFRDFFMATGCVSATRPSMDYLLSKAGPGRALCLVVGGAKESLDSHPGQVILHLTKRKGFCKMALRHGASLVPMFSFGENEIYDQVSNPHGSLLRRMQNSIQEVMGLAPIILMGRGILQYSFGIVPYRKPIYTVVGSPIDVPQVTNPTSKEIVDLHGRYVRALIDLYNKYKDRYSEHPELDIQIV